ncbi:MAG: COX15/CtaA family protein [Methylococcaceae bacterium]
MNQTDWVRRYRITGIITIFAVYLLILVGGTVRASGAGMGCPDWPTCFGRWIPPTDASQLPPDYHQAYQQRGYANTDFNLIKTWTEYLNRLLGVSIGLLIFLTFLFSVSFLKTDKTIFYLSLSAFLMVGFQGWLGSVVVASNLKPLLITVHMLVALLIVATLIYTVSRSQMELLLQNQSQPISEKIYLWLCIAISLTVLQIIMGTQIREAVDVIAEKHHALNREFWGKEFPIIFYIHRSFSSLILIINIWISWQIRKSIGKQSFLFKSTLLLNVLVIMAILAGISLDRLGFPAVAQPIHLVLATMIFGSQFFLLICIRSMRIKQHLNLQCT